MEADEAPELGNWCSVVVDAQVDPTVVAATIAAAGTNDRDCRGLLVATVSSRRLSGIESRQQSIGEWIVTGRVALGHRVDDFRAGQDIALAAEAVTGATTGP